MKVQASKRRSGHTFDTDPLSGINLQARCSMGSIIIPSRHRADSSSPFGDLVDSPAKMQKVALRIAQVLAKSFDEDERRHGKDFVKWVHSETEEKRRADILGRWFRDLRGGLNWSIEKSLDHLAPALRTELDGGTYNPPSERQRLWVPGG